MRQVLSAGVGGGLADRFLALLSSDGYQQPGNLGAGDCDISVVELEAFLDLCLSQLRLM